MLQSSQSFDYRSYWKKRLKKAKNNLAGVGHKRFGDRANRLMYQRVNDVLMHVLKERKIPVKNKQILDAGAGIGMFVGIYKDLGAKITALDISPDALQILKKRYPSVKTITSGLEDLNKRVKRSSFDIVHCFDVLYHITADNQWEKAVRNLAFASKEYIIVHVISEQWHNSFHAVHVRALRNTRLRELLGEYGFIEEASYPTHVFYTKMPFYFIARYFPQFFYNMDAF